MGQVTVPPLGGGGGGQRGAGVLVEPFVDLPCCLSQPSTKSYWMQPLKSTYLQRGGGSSNGANRCVACTLQTRSARTYRISIVLHAHSIRVAGDQAIPRPCSRRGIHRKRPTNPPPPPRKPPCLSQIKPIYIQSLPRIVPGHQRQSGRQRHGPKNKGTATDHVGTHTALYFLSFFSSSPSTTTSRTAKCFSRRRCRYSGSRMLQFAWRHLATKKLNRVVEDHVPSTYSFCSRAGAPEGTHCFSGRLSASNRAKPEPHPATTSSATRMTWASAEKAGVVGMQWSKGGRDGR